MAQNIDMSCFGYGRICPTINTGYLWWFNDEDHFALMIKSHSIWGVVSNYIPYTTLGILLVGNPLYSNSNQLDTEITRNSMI